tara:strand:+ start:2046 stop:2339 length:294 start_codon:yes stop_codon:yes gene_type:complete
MDNISTQPQRLLEYLQKGHTINRLRSFKELGIFELSARICDLEKDGHEFEKRRVKSSNQWGKYSYVQYKLKGNPEPIKLSGFKGSALEAKKYLSQYC